MQLALGLTRKPDHAMAGLDAFINELTEFDDFGQTTRILETVVAGPNGKELRVPTYVNEF